MSKKLLFRLAVLVTAMMSALGVTAQEDYVCYTPENTTLTFYYDNYCNSRPGTTYTVEGHETYPAVAALSNTGDLAKGNVEKVTLLESLYPNPVMLPAIEEYININKFRADWTHDTDKANVLSYTLEVMPKPEEPEVPEVQEIANIDFSGVTAVTEYDHMPNQVDNYAQYVPEGWVVNTYLFVNNGFVISGSGGSFVSPTYDLTGYDKVTVVIDAYTFFASYYGTAQLNISTGSASQNLTLATDDFQTYTVVLDCAASDQVTIAGTANYFAVRGIKVYAGDLNAANNMLMIQETGDETYRLITGITEKFYTVENLTEEGTFLYRVKALYADGTESGWSNIEEVTLFENTPAFQLGDVNHDGDVNIADVTALIDLLLGGGAISNPATDCNQDGDVNIADVSTLIDYLLSGSWPEPVYTVVGTPNLFESEWDLNDERNNMIKGADGIYRLNKAGWFPEGTEIYFKIVTNHSYAYSWPARSDRLPTQSAAFFC